MLPFPKKQTSVRKRVLQFVPWIVSAGAITYIISTTNFTIVAETLVNLQIIPFVVLIFSSVFANYLIDIFTYRILFNRFYRSISFRDLFLFKGASYVLQVFHYYLSGTVMAGVVHLRHRFPLAACLSGLVWLAMLDFVALGTWIFVGYCVSSGTGFDALDKWVIPGTIIIVLGFCLISMLLRGSWSCIEKFRLTDFVFVFRKVRVADLVIFLFLRLVYLFVSIFMTWFLLPLFDIEIPLRELILLMPVLMFVGSIPLAGIAGLGTAQIVMRIMFSPYAPQGDAQIDAYAVTTILALIIARLAIGLFSMPTVSQEVSRIGRLSRGE